MGASTLPQSHAANFFRYVTLFNPSTPLTPCQVVLTQCWAGSSSQIGVQTATFGTHGVEPVLRTAPLAAFIPLDGFIEPFLKGKTTWPPLRQVMVTILASRQPLLLLSISAMNPIHMSFKATSSPTGEQYQHYTRYLVQPRPEDF